IHSWGSDFNNSAIVGKAGLPVLEVCRGDRDHSGVSRGILCLVAVAVPCRGNERHVISLGIFNGSPQRFGIIRDSETHIDHSGSVSDGVSYRLNDVGKVSLAGIVEYAQRHYETIGG